MDRRDIGSWLSTPGQAPDTLARPQAFRGQRLGLPESGRGSIAGVGRRFAAIAIDWVSSLLVASLLTSSLGVAGDFGLITLAVFAVQVTVLTFLSGASFGQKFLGIRIERLDTQPIGLPRAALRTGLICLAIPPVVWDQDTRGLHDKAAGTVCVHA